MLRKRKLKYILSLMLLVLSLSACSTTGSYKTCTVFPVGGVQVGKEIEKIPYQGYEHFWEWLGRLQKLKEELDICETM